MLYLGLFIRSISKFCVASTFYCLFSYSNTACTNDVLVIKKCHSYDQYSACIKNVFVQSEFLEHLTFHSDTPMQQAEFTYLTDLKEYSFITANDVIKAIYYLLKKATVECITIERTPGICGICLHVKIACCATLGRITIQGVLTDKQNYVRYYGMDRGSYFDHGIHKQSLEKIKEACQEEGYFDTSVASVLVYEDQRKTVNPTITINKGSRFIISAVAITVQDDNAILGDQEAVQDTNDQKEVLQKKIYRLFLKKIVKKSYHKKLLNQQALEIKEYLTNQGFVATISLDELVENDTQTVRLKWHIDVHYKCSFVFWGNSFFSHTYLQEHLKQFCKSAWLLPASLVAQEIERLYHEKGFWQVTIETQEEKDRYFFMIKEGDRASISGVSCVAAHQIGADILIKNCFSHFLKAAYFDQALLENSLKQVRTYYEKNGFLDARIVGHECVGKEYDKTLPENTYIVRIIMEEGEVKRCAGVEIPLFPELCMQGPFKNIYNASEKKIVSFQLIQEQRAFVQQYLRDHGYRILSVEPELRNLNKNELIIVWHIDGDKTPFYIGKTVIQGHCACPFEHIMRELPYKQGELWQQDILKKTFMLFKSRGVFDVIQVHAEHNKHAKTSFHKEDGHEKTILLRLHHDEPFEVRTRVGLGFQHVQDYQTFGGLTYKLGGSFMYKNPTKRADILSAQIDCARSHHELLVKYMVPWILRLPCDGFAQLYNTYYVQPGFIGSNSNIYAVTHQGALLGVHKRTLHGEGSIQMGLEGMRTTMEVRSPARCALVAEMARAIDFTPRLQHTMVPFFFLESTLYTDYVDDKLNPIQGTYALITAKSMMPLREKYAHSFFIKLLAECACFMPVGPGVAAMRLRVGHIFYQQFNAIMPTERFYLGGSHSVRGYNADVAPPLGFFIDSQGKQQTVPRGGKTMINGNGEVRIPLFTSVGGVLFQDMGILCGDSYADFKAENMVAATGFGMRIYTPVGPLRFDIGFNWRTPYPQGSRFAWFLTFGQAF